MKRIFLLVLLLAVSFARAEGVKISDLPLLGGASIGSTDSFPIVNVSGNRTVRMYASDILSVPAVSATLTARINANFPTCTSGQFLEWSGSGFTACGTASGGGTWGSITGTLSNQTDLAAALALKAPLASPTFTGTITTPLTASRVVATGASSELSAATTTLTQVNYLSGATGTTGTNTTNLVFSTLPTFERAIVAGSVTGASQGLNVTTTFDLTSAGASGIRSAPALAANSTATFVRFFTTGSVTLGSGASVANVVEYYSNGQTAGTSNAALADNTAFSGDFFINNSSARASLFGGTVTVANLIDSGLTATTVPYVNGSKQFTSSAVTPTQLGYLSGASGTTGTGSLVYNTSPSFLTSVLFGNYHLEPSEYNQGNSSTAVTVNWANGSAQLVTLTGNATFSFSNPVTGGTYLLKLTTDSGGPYTQSWPAAVKWNNSATPQTGAAAATDYVSFYYDGTNYRGSFWTEAVPSVFAGGLGSAGSPTFTLSANLTTGMYSSATNNIDVSTNGTQRLNVGATGAVTLTTSSGANLLWGTLGGGNIGAGTSSTITNAPATIYFQNRLQGNSQSGSNANFYVDVSTATGDLELFNGARNKVIGLLVDGSYGYIVFGGAGNLLFDGTNIYSTKPMVSNTDATSNLGIAANRWKNLYLSGLISRGYIRATAAAAGSTTLAVTTGVQVFKTTSPPLATYTVTMPASPVDQQTIDITFDGVVTALTLSPNSGQSIAGTYTSYTPGTTRLSFIWVSTDSTWYPL